MLTESELKALFYYNGFDLCNAYTRGPARIDSVAGAVNSKGYRHIRVANRFYLAHRLVWVFHGRCLLDTDIIDHIDRNKLNNSLLNLRIVTASENSLNRGIADAGIIIQNSKFKVQFHHRSKRYYGGVFNSIEEARVAKLAIINRLEA